MAEIRHFPRSGFPATRQNVAFKVAPAEPSAASAQIHCVYNQSRERFVATSVEAVDTFSDSPEARLRTLEPTAGTGLWFCPCLEISPSSIRFPLDLVYLDNDCAVLATVQSFPLASPAILGKTAGSVLALQANTVAEGEIQVGDRLILSAPEEMMGHLQSMKDAKTQAQGTLSLFLEQFAIAPAAVQDGPAPEEPERSAVDAVGAVDFEPAAPVETAPVETAPVETAPVEIAPVETAPVKAEVATAEISAPEKPSPSPRSESLARMKAEPRNWFKRLVMGDPPADPRKATRESLPGLIAYFFTGGTPKAHPVRDISTTGMFIITNARWYPGTVVRITLTDRHDPTVERSITVNAKAVRWGSDGVGLEFLLEDTDRRKKKTVRHVDENNRRGSVPT